MLLLSERVAVLRGKRAVLLPSEQVAVLRSERAVLLLSERVAVLRGKRACEVVLFKSDWSEDGPS